MKQEEFNRVLVSMANSTANLEPAFDGPWWTNANMSYRERLARVQCDTLSELATIFGLKFSPSKYVRTALPDSDARRRIWLLANTHDFVNGIWCEKDTDPYADGTVRAHASQATLDVIDGYNLGAGIAGIGLQD